MRARPEVVEGVLRGLRERDASIQELYTAVRTSGVRSVRGNMLYLEYARIAERERARRRDAMNERLPEARADDAQPMLFTACPRCGRLLGGEQTTCPGCDQADG